MRFTALPYLGAWTEPIHGMLLVGMSIVGLACLVSAIVKITLWALTVLAALKGR